MIEKTHDLRYIAEFALRKQWPMLSEMDRQRFIAAFEKLSVMTYASRFKNVTERTFKSSGPPTIESGRAHVLTAIARQAQPDVSLDYMLEQKDGSMANHQHHRRWCERLALTPSAMMLTIRHAPTFCSSM